MSEIIETKYGKIRGIKKDGCTCFLGIPFAKAPVENWQKNSQKKCASEKWNFGVHLVRL